MSTLRVRALIVIGMTLLLGLVASAGSVGAQVAPDPTSGQGQLRGVIDDLTPFAGDSRRIDRAIKNIDRSLDSRLWVDENHLNPRRGRRVFASQQRTVRLLTRVVRRPGDTGAEALAAAQEATNDLLSASRFLAVTLAGEVGDAVNPRRQNRVDRLLARAQAHLDRGDAAMAADGPSRAIRHYIRAWQFAARAARQAEKPARDAITAEIAEVSERIPMYALTSPLSASSAVTPSRS